MNKLRILSHQEIEAALEAASNQRALSDYREAMSKGDKIAAIVIARQAGLFMDK